MDPRRRPLGCGAWDPHLRSTSLSYGWSRRQYRVTVGLTSGSVIDPAYYAAKHAVVAISECQFHDFAERFPGINVSVLLRASSDEFMDDETIA